MYDWNGEGSRFTGAGLSNSQHVLSFQNRWHSFVLDIRGAPEAHFLQVSLDLNGNAIFFELHRCLVNGDGMIG